MAPTSAHRIALAVHDHLRQQHDAIHRIELPEATWSKCRDLHRQRKLALGRDWELAARRLEQDLQSQLKTLADQMRALTSRFASDARPRLTTATDIYQEIMSLCAEFDDVTWSRPDGTLSVTTEDIVLEGIDLGRFQIELDWRELPDTACFRVIALDPNPASSNEYVTHPHVEHESLCVGEAAMPIQYALKEGRIADFFLIVNNVLLTYNCSSAHVSLAGWHGVQCSDCGNLVDSDDRYACERCDRCLCQDCYRYCEPCSGYFCCECVVCCGACDHDVCHDCRKPCTSCESSFCPSCLEEKLCDHCQQDQNDDEETEGKAPEIPPAMRGPRSTDAIHADGLEQAAVLS